MKQFTFTLKGTITATAVTLIITIGVPWLYVNTDLFQHPSTLTIVLAVLAFTVVFGACLYSFVFAFGVHKEIAYRRSLRTQYKARYTRSVLHIEYEMQPPSSPPMHMTMKLSCHHSVQVPYATGVRHYECPLCARSGAQLKP